MTIETIQSVGFPIALIVAAIYLIAKAAPPVWDWYKDKVEREAEQQKQIVKDFTETMNGFKESADNQRVADTQSRVEFTALVERMDTSNSQRADRVLTVIEQTNELMSETRQSLDNQAQAFNKLASVLESAGGSDEK